MSSPVARFRSILCVIVTFFACAPLDLCGANSARGDEGRVRVIIDTDMGFDDWMAVLYLLNKPDLEIVAITVDCAGETHCPAGAVNVTKLLALAGRKDIPVYFGVQPVATLPFQFPKVIRDSATQMDVPGFNDIPGTKEFSAGAAAQMLHLARQAGQANAPLTILSIGTSTNIALAIQRAKEDGSFGAFAKGIRMIYKGGGAVGEEVNGSLSNKNIKGNLNIPEIYTSDNKTAEWNVYANAPGIETILEAGLPVTLVPTNLSDQVKVTKQSYEMLKSIASTRSSHFVVAVIESTVSSQGGWSEAELEYWDPSVVVAALNAGFVTTKYDSVQICVDTRKNDAHGTVFIDTPAGNTSKCREIGAVAGTVSIYTAIDTDQFYRDFFSTLNRE